MTWRSIVTAIASACRRGRAPIAQAADDFKKTQRAEWAAASKRYRERKRARKTVIDAVNDASLSVIDAVNDASLSVNDAPNREVGLKKRERAPPLGNVLPKDFEPDAQSSQLATELYGGNAHAKIASFCEWAWAHGTTRDDWQAQLRWWLRFEAKQLTLPLSSRPSLVPGDQHVQAAQRGRSTTGGSVAQVARQRAEQKFAGGNGPS